VRRLQQSQALRQFTASRDYPSGTITQAQSRIDIITDADKATLTVWMKYMQAVDTAAPDII